MSDSRRLTDGLDAALVEAKAEYGRAVLRLAVAETAKDHATPRQPADVDEIHQARTRVIALEAAREELSRLIDEGGLLSA